MQFQDHLDLYQRTLTSWGRRKQGVETYVKHLKWFFHWLEQRGLETISERAIAHYQADIGARWKAKTIRNTLSAIRSFCAWGIREGLFLSDPTQAMVFPKKPIHLPRALSEDEVRTLFLVIRQPDDLSPEKERLWRRNRCIMYVMYYAGLRLSEVAALRWRHIDFDARTLIVEDGKGGKSRMIPIHERLVQELMHVRRRSQDDAVIYQYAGKPVSPKTIAGVFQRWLKRLGLSISSHRLRHSFATQLRREGVDLRVIQTLLGHTSLATTEIYLMVDVKDTREAVNQLPVWN